MNKIKAIYQSLSYFDRIYTRLRYAVEIYRSLQNIETTELSPREKKEINEFYKNFNFHDINPAWHKLYKSINGVFDKKYIPEDLYYTRIEPALNQLKDYAGLLDKNLLPVFFPIVKIPATIIHNKNGFFFDKDNNLISSSFAADACSAHKKFIIKPSLSVGQGENVKLIRTDEVNSTSMHKTFLAYQKDFIIQEYIEQHPKFKVLNESSVNTIRVLSYLNHEKSHILSKYLRVGGKDEIADNANRKSLACGIKENKYLTFAVDDDCHKRYRTETGIAIKNYEIPDISELLETVKRLHQHMPYFKLISWDMCLDRSENVVLIEYNVKWQDIIAYQQLYPKTLFGDFNQEILHLTKSYWQEKGYSDSLR